MELLATERIRTEHNCVLRDLVAVGDRLILGYQVHLGLKTATAVGDVFMELVHDGTRFAPAALSFYWQYTRDEDDESPESYLGAIEEFGALIRTEFPR